jgi:four helix bundle protein
MNNSQSAKRRAHSICLQGMASILHYKYCIELPNLNKVYVSMWDYVTKFRFQDLEIWKLSIEIGDKLFNIADLLEKRKLYRFAEQLRSAGLSMSNNISEGSGSNSKKEFNQFLNIARRSTFENANIVIVLNRQKLIDSKYTNELLDDLDHLCRKISNFQKSLSKQKIAQ